jgi:hypothetical protein
LSVVEGEDPTSVVATAVAPPLSVGIAAYVGAAAATLSVFDGEEPPSATATLVEAEDPASDATTEATTDATTDEGATTATDEICDAATTELTAAIAEVVHGVADAPVLPL